jgi:seryl-tRNA synthetase
MDLEEQNELLRAICDDKSDSTKALLGLIDRYEELCGDLETLREETRALREERDRLLFYVNDVDSDKFRELDRESVQKTLTHILDQAVRAFKIYDWEWNSQRSCYRVVKTSGQKRTIFIPSETDPDFGVALKEGLLNLANILNDSLVRVYLIVADKPREIRF